MKEQNVKDTMYREITMENLACQIQNTHEMITF